jgi:hypothetical protein
LIISPAIHAQASASAGAWWWFFRSYPQRAATVRKSGGWASCCRALPQSLAGAAILSALLLLPENRKDFGRIVKLKLKKMIPLQCRINV